MKKLFTAVSLGATFFVAQALFANAQSAGTSTVSTNPNCVILTTDMGLGARDASTSGQVTKLQNFLISRGFLRGESSGYYGPQTDRAVRTFQRDNGIIATGYVGPITRTNIQAISCAVGAIDTSNLSSVISSSSLPLLTFISPVSGALVIKGQKDLPVDWTLGSGVVSAFASSSADVAISFDLVGSDGTSVATMGNATLTEKTQNRRVEAEFKRTLKSGKANKNGDIPTGQYKIKATIRYKGNNTSIATQASRYASESGWFTIADPAPEPVIKVTASTTTIATSQPVTLTWEITPQSVCTVFDGTATTSISVTGSKVVTPAQTTTYRFECALTSEWPFTGSIYKTSARKNVVITIGSATTSTNPPVITSLSPSSGQTGATVTISGSGFTNAGNSVYMDFQATTTSSESRWYVLGNDLHATSEGTALSFFFPAMYPCPTYGNGGVGCAIPTSISGTHTIWVKNANGISNSATFTVQASSTCSATQTTGCAQSTSTIPAITAEELARGWYYGDANQKKPGTPSTWVLVGAGTRNAMWKAPSEGSSTLEEPVFTATCARAARDTFKITLRWNKVTGATNYPVRIQGPSFATNATQYNGQSVVGFNNPGDNPTAPTGTSYTFEGLTAAGDYQYWGHAWNSTVGWSANTVKTVTCSSRTSSSDSGPTVLGAASMCVDLPYNLHRGAESQSVTNLQNFLIANGHLSGNATGFYGDMTVEAVKSYQGGKGLPATGMVYDFTRAAIVADSCQ